MGNRRSKPPPYRRLRVYITAAVLGFIAAGAALILFSLLVFFLRLPTAHSRFFSLLAFGIGCFTAGVFAGKTKRQNGLGTGVKAALLFTLPVVLLGFALGEVVDATTAADAATTAGTPALLSAFNKVMLASLCGAVGGVVGVNKDGGF